jgi:hypothetical protein
MNLAVLLSHDVHKHSLESLLAYAVTQSVPAPPELVGQYMSNRLPVVGLDGLTLGAPRPLSLQPQLASMVHVFEQAFDTQLQTGFWVARQPLLPQAVPYWVLQFAQLPGVPQLVAVPAQAGNWQQHP